MEVQDWIHYYLSKGYTLERAVELIRERVNNCE